METPLEWLALARGGLDRAAERRTDDAWLAGRWADPRTRVLVVERGQALIRSTGDGPELILVGPDDAPEGDRYLLGVDDEDVAYFAVSGALPAIEGSDTADLRRIGAALGDRDSTLFTQAVALQNWHGTHTHCPRCGAPTDIAKAGHTRLCPADGSEHFPRLDPAVIMLVHDDRDRVLLGRAPTWPEHMMSILAGFVEPGESLEQSVAREVREEVGMTVDRIAYLGSQPWPLPQSLMLGFFCRAPGDQEPALESDEIAEARWFTREELRTATEDGSVMIPGRVSIARQLIERWYGGPLRGSWRR
ncbi:NAD(+) diphosphatase [Thermomonospora cellulosilytica]|uniref:NAD(+) diphosphatase n=1 Tax=Thermomonospora cellulosilytica TaxID=1411118 RepID=A0A7W3N4Q6_9ACTN|nr:NAD(+) diphosphatase [Thermomonospora cellulosilytica]MBA9007526.1 NAD+ diphosphatase [Thermomonospora cellulosilytica]